MSESENIWTNEHVQLEFAEPKTAYTRIALSEYWAQASINQAYLVFEEKTNLPTQVMNECSPGLTLPIRWENWVLSALYSILSQALIFDIYGWHIEARNLYFSAAFFMVENFYANHPPRLYRSVEDDIYGPWTIDFPPTK